MRFTLSIQATSTTEDENIEKQPDIAKLYENKVVFNTATADTADTEAAEAVASLRVHRQYFGEFLSGAIHLAQSRSPTPTQTPSEEEIEQVAFEEDNFGPLRARLRRAVTNYRNRDDQAN